MTLIIRVYTCFFFKNCIIVSGRNNDKTNFFFPMTRIKMRFHHILVWVPTWGVIRSPWDPDLPGGPWASWGSDPQVLEKAGGKEELRASCVGQIQSGRKTFSWLNKLSEHDINCYRCSWCSGSGCSSSHPSEGGSHHGLSHHRLPHHGLHQGSSRPSCGRLIPQEQ